MSKLLVRRKDKTVFIPPRDGALLDYIQANGRTPPVTLSIFALEDINSERQFDQFVSYKFGSSILVPVDTFECEVYYRRIDGQRKPREGDVFVLRANGQAISTGIVDQLSMKTLARGGTTLHIVGRDLLGQWEDQDSVSLDSSILYSNNYTVDQVVRALANNTRIDPNRLEKRDAPKQPYLAATQPGESKISSMQRYCQALDIYFWMSGDGRLIVGRPDMYGIRSGNKGTWFCLEDGRKSNVTAIGSTRASTQIPNIMLPIWTGQENVQSRTLPQKPLYNRAEGPARLRSYGHRVPKAVVTSTPQGSAPQDLADVNALIIAKQNADQQKLSESGAATILQAYAKREMARANVKELKVEVNIPGHYNGRAEAVMPDQTYRIQYDNDDIDKDMYLFEVEHSMDSKTGPTSKLIFTNQTAIVSDVRAL